MKRYQYEICLHFLKADQAQTWNPGALRLEVYADGDPKKTLICYADDLNIWDLSDVCYHFRRRIQFQLVEDDGSELGKLVANFTVPSGSTHGSDVQIYDEAGYTLNYTISLIQAMHQPISNLSR